MNKKTSPQRCKLKRRKTNATQSPDRTCPSPLSKNRCIIKRCTECKTSHIFSSAMDQCPSCARKNICNESSLEMQCDDHNTVLSKKSDDDHSDTKVVSPCDKGLHKKLKTAHNVTPEIKNHPENTNKNEIIELLSSSSDDEEIIIDMTRDGSLSSSSYVPKKNEKKDIVGTTIALAPPFQQATSAKRSLPSVNDVLLAGAKRLAVTKKNDGGRTRVTRSKDGTSGVSAERQNENGSNRRSSCPAYKRIRGTDFICDGFRYANTSLSTHYFLTHFHYDHYGGITSSWDSGTIYCSEPTARLVQLQLKVQPQFLRPLPLNTPITISSSSPPVTVILIDANHCPGAVMFLFRIREKHLLHVGDFRWDRNVMMAPSSPLLAYCAVGGGVATLDEIYLDTTYCQMKYAAMPTQSQAIASTINVVEHEITTYHNKRHECLFLFGAYTIGKERLYLAVCRHLGMKAYVDRQRYRILSSLGWSQETMNLLTTDKTTTNIWIVPLAHITFGKMGNYQTTKAFAKRYHRVVGFRPTGWSLSQSSSPSSKFDNIVSVTTNHQCNAAIYGVPYSEHSSFSELVDCLSCLRPKRITPTVSPGKWRDQVELLMGEVNKERQERKGAIKESDSGL